MSDETGILRHIWLAVAKTTTLFRLQTGQGWVGKGKAIRSPDGSIRLSFARPIAIGLSHPNGKSVIGASDTIGWTTIVIQPSMVGSKVAVFTGLEMKNSKGGRRSPEQRNWCDNVTRAGGIAGFASSPQEAQNLITDYLIKLDG